MHTRKLGKLAEDAAVQYLTKLNYKILESNYYFFGGEIDIIAMHDNQLVFVEVKSIHVSLRDELMALISKKKLKRLQRSINHWLLKHKMLAWDWRLDYIGVVTKNQQVVEIKHLMNI